MPSNRNVEHRVLTGVEKAEQLKREVMYMPSNVNVN